MRPYSEGCHCNHHEATHSDYLSLPLLGFDYGHGKWGTLGMRWGGLVPGNERLMRRVDRSNRSFSAQVRRS
jgi:hypothetical protein